MNTHQKTEKIMAFMLTIFMCALYMPVFPNTGFALEAPPQDQGFNQMTGANQKEIQVDKAADKMTGSAPAENPNAGTSIGAIAISDGSPLNAVTPSTTSTEPAAPPTAAIAQATMANQKLVNLGATAAPAATTVPADITNYVNSYLRDKVFNANGVNNTITVFPSADTTSSYCSGIFACYTVEVSPINQVPGGLEKFNLDISGYDVGGLAELHGFNMSAQFNNPGAGSFRFSENDTEVILDWLYTYVYLTENVKFPGSNLAYGFTQINIELKDTTEAIFSYPLPSGKKYFSLKGGVITKADQSIPGIPAPVKKYYDNLKSAFGNEPYSITVKKSDRPDYFTITIASTAANHTPNKFAELKLDVKVNGSVVGPEEVLSYKLWADPADTELPQYFMVPHDAQVWFDYWKQLKPNGWSAPYTMTHTTLKQWGMLTPSTGEIRGGKMSVPTPAGGRNDYGYYYDDQILLDVPASVNAYADSLRGPGKTFSADYTIDTSPRDAAQNVYLIAVSYRKSTPPLPDGQIQALYFTVKLSSNGTVTPQLEEHGVLNLIFRIDGRRMFLAPWTLSNYVKWAQVTQPSGIKDPLKVLALTNYNSYNGDHNISKFTLKGKVYVEFENWVLPEKVYESMNTLMEQFPGDSWDINLAYVPKTPDTVTVKISPKTTAAPGAIQEIKFNMKLSGSKVTRVTSTLSLTYANPVAGGPNVLIAGANATGLYSWLTSKRPNRVDPLIEIRNIKIISETGSGSKKTIKFSLIVNGVLKVFTLKSGHVR